MAGGRAYISQLLADAKQRAKKRKILFELTVDDLLAAATQSGGVCRYRGCQLVFAQMTRNDPLYFFGASLDRIDPPLGYTVGNIQFISRFANFAKNALSHEEFINHIRLAAAHLALTDPQRMSA